MVDAIILAGGENNKRFSRYCQEKYPAMIEIHGRPMVCYVADALQKSANVRKIYVAGPAKRLAGCPLPSSAEIVEGGSGIMQTITLAMEALGHQEKTLVATADIPLLTSLAVDDFLGLCAQRQADLYYPVIAKEVYEKRFPESRRTYVRLRNGVFTGGNLFLADPKIVSKCAQVAEGIILNRKNPFKLCCMLGWKFVLKFVSGQLGMKETEERASEMLGIKGAVFESLHPELGIDVDKPDDLKVVEKEFLKMGGRDESLSFSPEQDK